MRAFAIATLAAATIAVPVQAATITNYKVAGWNMGAYTNDSTRRFSHCAASAQYKNGLLLLFSVSESFQWSIGFSNENWNLRQGRDLDIRYVIDGGRVNSARASAVSNRLIRARMPDSVDLFNQFRQGLRLVVTIDDNAPVTFNLTDTNVMLTEILQCAKKYKDYADNNAPNRPNADRGDRDFGPSNNRATPERNQQDRNQDRTPDRNSGPGSSGSWRDDRMENRVSRIPDREETPRPERQPTQPPADTNTSIGPTPDSRTEAVNLATDILRRANFTFEFQKPEQQSQTFRDKYDAVWRADGILGTLRVLAGSRAATIERLRGQLIADDANACKGKFASGALPTTSGSQSQSIFTSCEGQENWSIYYIAVPRRQGGVYLLGIAGTGDVASRVQGVAYAYRTVALEVLEK